MDSHHLINKKINSTDIPIIDADKGGYWRIYKNHEGQLIKREFVKNMDYAKFGEMVKEKKANQKWFSMEIDESEIFTFKSMEKIRQQNAFSKEMEWVWLVVLENSDGNEKEWTVSNLAIYNQFEKQGINEGDKVRVSCVANGKNKKYVVELSKRSGDESNNSEVSQ